MQAGVATLRIARSDFAGPTRCQWRNNTSPNATVSSVLAPYGCVVLRYGNILEDDGTLMNQFGPITYDQSDVFILGPSQAEQTYQVHFSYHGLQYVWVRYRCSLDLSACRRFVLRKSQCC